MVNHEKLKVILKLHITQQNPASVNCYNEKDTILFYTQ